MQPGRLGGQPPGPAGGEPVVAAQPAPGDLLVVHLDQTVGAQPVQRGVQRAGAQADPAPGDLRSRLPVTGTLMAR